MRRYIDADNLIKKMQGRYDDLSSADGVYDHFTQGYADALSTVEKEPTADAREVWHGRWIGKPISGFADCKCSVCGRVTNIHASMGIVTQKYCPICGARMDGEYEQTT